MIPTITTKRLILNSFTLDDSECVETMAGNEAVARPILNLPHPYPAGAAKLWIATHTSSFLKGDGATWAVRLADETLIGCMNLVIHKTDERAVLGYWIGLEYWNKGYATEAAEACIKFGFERLSLQKITARHLAFNSASGRVMEKIGMTKEAHFRSHSVKSGIRHDILEYGILKQK